MLMMEWNEEHTQMNERGRIQQTCWKNNFSSEERKSEMKDKPSDPLSRSRYSSSSVPILMTMVQRQKSKQVIDKQRCISKRRL
jgi:hypothetical protein